MSAQRQGSWGLLAASFGYGLCVAAWGAWVLGYTGMHEMCRGCLGWETQVTPGLEAQISPRQPGGKEWWGVPDEGWGTGLLGPTAN